MAVHERRLRVASEQWSTSSGLPWPTPKFTLAQNAEACRRRAEDATLKELAQSYDVGLRRFRGYRGGRVNSHEDHDYRRDNAHPQPDT
jgi:biotin carboxylase